MQQAISGPQIQGCWTYLTYIVSKDVATGFRAGVVGSILFNFVATYVNLLQTIINEYDVWAVSIVSMIFVPLIVLFFISMMDYVTGGTNA